MGKCKTKVIQAGLGTFRHIQELFWNSTCNSQNQRHI